MKRPDPKRVALSDEVDCMVGSMDGSVHHVVICHLFQAIS